MNQKLVKGRLLGGGALEGVIAAGLERDRKAQLNQESSGSKKNQEPKPAVPVKLTEEQINEIL